MKASEVTKEIEERIDGMHELIRKNNLNMTEIVICQANIICLNDLKGWVIENESE